MQTNSNLATPEQILKKYWGYDTFRPLQKEIINSVLHQQDTLALLPTGGGKSICYQVPAIMLDGVTLVITPLVALMQDQVEQLKENGVAAEYISASMHYSDIKRILENTVNGAYDLLYISPERLQSRLFNEYLPAIKLNLIAVDEAHCISQWGHDFRPDYLKIAILKEIFKKTPVLAVTASATQQVVDDIIKQLKIKEVQFFSNSFERANIYYQVKYSEQKNKELIELLNEIKGSTIIYCRSRRQTEQLSKQLLNHGINTVAYHAGMSRDKRSEHRISWSNNRTPVIVATTAFGMGIDKSDVKHVIHYDIPEHIEAYYQESGRAGRDDKQAFATMLYNQTDINKLANSIDIHFPPYDFIRKVYQSVAEYLHIATGTEPNRYYPFDLADFCKKFKLPAPATANALKLLEQEGLWTLTDAVFKPSTIQVLADRREIDNIGRNYHELGILLTTILRLYGTLYYHPTPVNIKVIAKHLKTKNQLVTQLLQQLDKMGIIQFSQPKDGPQLFFHHYRVDSQHLEINTKRINNLRDLYKQRIKSISAFTTEDKKCRTKMLLQYFGQEYNANCGHCDNCRNTIPKDKNIEYKNLIIKTIGNSTESKIKDLISSLAEYSETEILAAIRQLLDDGTIGSKEDNKLYIK